MDEKKPPKHVRPDAQVFGAEMGKGVCKDEFTNAVRGIEGKLQSHRPPKGDADDVRFGDFQVIKEFENIPCHFRDAGMAGVRRLTETAEVGGDDAISGFLKGGKLQLPGGTIRAEAMQENDGGKSGGVEAEMV